MLAETIDPAATTPADLHERYLRELARVVESVGAARIADETDVDRDRLDALLAGDEPTVTVSEAADVLSFAETRPEADAILAELRDNLMLQMSSAVLDVDGVERGLDGDMEARTIQQKIEGRQPMTLAEYARVHRHIAAENPY